MDSGSSIIRTLETSIRSLQENMDVVSEKSGLMLIQKISKVNAEADRCRSQSVSKSTESRKRGPESDIVQIWNPSTHHGVTKILDHIMHNGEPALSLTAKKDREANKTGSDFQYEFIATKSSFDDIYNMTGIADSTKKTNRQHIAKLIREYFQRRNNHYESHEKIFTGTDWGQNLIKDMKSNDAKDSITCIVPECNTRFRWQDVGYQQKPGEFAMCVKCLNTSGKTPADVQKQESETKILNEYFASPKCEWERKEAKFTQADILNQFMIQFSPLPAPVILIQHWRQVSTVNPTFAVEVYTYSPEYKTLVIAERYDIDSVRKRTLRVLVHTIMGRPVYWLVREKFH